MMKQEFEKLTGIFPSDNLFKVIEKRYMDSKDDKEKFCEAYKNNVDGMAQSIQYEADVELFKMREKFGRQIKDANTATEILQKQMEGMAKILDKELEWKPYECSNMDQEEYKRLHDEGSSEVMDPERAAEWIEETFGFAKDRIKIFTEIQSHEVNRHHRIRETGTVKRDPVYNATDWNYCRFKVNGWKYEAVNGSLQQYND